MLEITDISPIGQQALNERHALIVGISINNSYFKEPALERLLIWATSLVESVYIMIPDEPSVFTLMALGYSKKKAEKEARLKSNNLENKCLAIANRLGLKNITIIRWATLTGSREYLAALAEIKYAYDNQPHLKRALRLTTSKVIAHALSRTPTNDEIDLGVMFLLQELAFICRSNFILKHEKIAYVYHKTMRVMKDVIEGHYYLFRPSNVGFITAE